MTTAPYMPGTEDLYTGTHEQRATLELSDGTTTWRPIIQAGTLRLSEDWSPYGQLSVTAADTFTQEALAALDPRRPGGILAQALAGYVHPDGTEDLHPIITGHLRSRVSRSPAGVLDLEVWTDDGLAHDAGWLGADSFKSFDGVNEAVAWCIQYATQAGVLLDSTLPNGYRPELVTGLALTPGLSMWEILDNIALAARVRIYADQDGRWQIKPKPTTAGKTVAYLQDGNGGTVESYNDTLARDDHYAAAVLVFTWTDAAGNDQKIVGTYGTPGAKTYKGDRPGPTTQAAANRAAQAVVANLSTRGNSYTCNGVAAWWLRPGHPVQVRLSSGATARHIVRSVSFDLMAGTMAVTTREPKNLGDENV